MVRLVAMFEAEYQAFLARDIEQYARENVRAGRWSAAEALDRSRQAHDRLLPQGRATPDHYLFTIEAPERGQPVGTIWLAVQRNAAEPTGFIYDLFIAQAYRRQGYGTQAMLALEAKARELGLHSLGLHVFAHNLPARALYRTLGYTGRRQLKKRLWPRE